MNTIRLVPSIAACAGLLAACASVGPDFVAPVAPVAADAVRLDAASRLAAGTQTLPEAWWTVFGDATLDTLQGRALDASPDLRTAALRFAQARVQRRMVAAQGGPELDLSAQAMRQRQSEHAAETRLVDAIGGAEAPALIELLSTPFPLYDAGFDLSWELDLWGRVRRSVEAADAGLDAAAAQWRDARLVVSAELARGYFELRGLQRRQALLTRGVAVAEDLLALEQARRHHGLADESAALSRAQELADLRARSTALQVQASAAVNRIGLLTGDAPGALDTLLAPPPGDADADADAVRALPALTLGVPAERVRARPDVRAAEARLHAATAQIGVATADLYPRIALRAGGGWQSMQADTLGDWASRTWRVGPVLSLPIFDRGRRRATIELRELQQQEAAVAWQRTVLTAWQEVADALDAHAAERERATLLRARAASRRDQLEFARAHAAQGLSSESVPLQAELAWRQAQDELTQSDTRLSTTLVALYKSVGGGDAPIEVAP